MQSSFTARSAYADMVVEEQPDGGAVIQVNNLVGSLTPMRWTEKDDEATVRGDRVSASIRLTPDQVSALRVWLETDRSPAAPVVRTAGGIDYAAWRNRIRRAAGQHPEA